LFGSVGVPQLSSVDTLSAYLIMITLMGIVIANASSFWQLILQLNTPPEIQGKIFGIAAMMANISMPIAYASIGLLLERIDFSIYLIGLGGILSLLSLIWSNSFNEHCEPINELE